MGNRLLQNLQHQLHRIIYKCNLSRLPWNYVIRIKPGATKALTPRCNSRPGGCRGGFTLGRNRSTTFSHCPPPTGALTEQRRGGGRRRYLCPSSWATVKAKGSPVSSLMLQLRWGWHIPATWDSPSVSQGRFIAAQMSFLGPGRGRTHRHRAERGCDSGRTHHGTRDVSRPTGTHAAPGQTGARMETSSGFPQWEDLRPFISPPLSHYPQLIIKSD